MEKYNENSKKKYINKGFNNKSYITNDDCISLKIGNITDIEKILNIMEIVRNQMNNKEYYVYPDYQNIKRILEEGGYIIKLLNKGNIIDFTIVTNFLSKEKINKLLTISNNFPTYEILNVAILKEYQRKGYFVKMLCYIEDILKKKQTNFNLISTVHPNNTQSLQAFKKSDYKEYDKKKLYGGLDRLILLKTIYK